MKKISLFFFCVLLLCQHTWASDDPKEKHKKKQKEAIALDSSMAKMIEFLQLKDSLTKVLTYQKGTVNLKGDFAKLNIPAGFKFLNPEQSTYVLTSVWGNPKRDDILGMIFPEDKDPFSDSSYAFIVSFDDMGYVKDKDADDINYDDMLKQIQADEKEINQARVAQGYPTIHMTGWAQKPFYDKNKKILHWAKSLQFGGDDINTLNYDIRILGRKGVLSLNAVATMNELSLVQKNIDQVLGMAEFTSGNKYEDYDSNTDKIAAWTIGGLVAGKVLAKAGFFVLLLKFWKLIVAGVIGAFYAIKKFFFKKQDEITPTATEEPSAPEDTTPTEP